MAAGRVRIPAAPRRLPTRGSFHTVSPAWECTCPRSSASPPAPRHRSETPSPPKQSFADSRAPKLELGNEGNFLPSIMTVA